MRTIARRSDQAVMTSCCETEYAVAVCESVTSLSAATFMARLTPPPPGVTETELEMLLPPTTDMTEWKVLGVWHRAGVQ